MRDGQPPVLVLDYRTASGGGLQRWAADVHDRHSGQTVHLTGSADIVPRFLVRGVPHPIRLWDGVETEVQGEVQLVRARGAEVGPLCLEIEGAAGKVAPVGPTRVDREPDGLDFHVTRFQGRLSASTDGEGALRFRWGKAAEHRHPVVWEVRPPIRWSPTAFWLRADGRGRASARVVVTSALPDKPLTGVRVQSPLGCECQVAAGPHGIVLDLTVPEDAPLLGAFVQLESELGAARIPVHVWNRTPESPDA